MLPARLPRGRRRRRPLARSYTEVNLKNFAEGLRQLAEACRLDQPVFEKLPSLESVAKNKCAPLCENTCATANDTICSDGGNHSINPGKEGRFYCAYGTDCADCGARPNDDLDCLILSGQAGLSEQIGKLSSPSLCDDHPPLTLMSPPPPPDEASGEAYN